MKYIAPAFNLAAFTCPICGVFSHFYWQELTEPHPAAKGILPELKSGIFCAICSHCSKRSLWIGALGRMVWPANTGNTPLPHQDMPDDVKHDYDEARNIFASSPRGSAALLRLAIQKLCKHLGEKGENINTDIGELVKKGLPIKIQQALDILRVTGNNAVHPGEIKIENDPSVAQSLFELVNVIIENRISEPARISAIYAALPSGATNGIAKRDKS